MMTIGFAVLFSWLSIARHLAYQSHAFDLGNMDQAVWNTLHGMPLRFTDMEVGTRVLTTRLAIHVEPLLAPLSLLYLFHSGPETLLIAQAVVVACGAPAAFLLGRALLGNDWLALAFPAAYLLHPSLQNAVLDDFHAVTMSAAFLLWALLFMYQGKLLPFAIAGILAASTKEEVGLLVGMMGIGFLLRARILAGVVILAAGLGWFFLCVSRIIPAANPSGHSPYLSRYSYLGHGLASVILSPLAHPGLVFSTLTSAERGSYLLHLLHPVAFVSLLGLPVLLLALPGLLVNMLSTDPHMYSGFYQYSAEIVPFVVAAAAFGVAFADEAASRMRAAHAKAVAPTLCILVLVAAAVDCRLNGFTPLSNGYIIPAAGPHQVLESRLLAAIPSDAVVAAADEMESHVSDRTWTYLLPTVHPTNGPAARYVALDASIPSRPVQPHVLHTLISHLLTKGYGFQSADDGVIVLRKGAPRKTLPPSFFRFIFSSGSNVKPERRQWGPLRLVGVIVHPRSTGINRSRPAVQVDSYWRVTGRIPPSAAIAFLLSPVYSGSHPRFSNAWSRETDSPTWDWLPLRRWPEHRTIRAQSLDMEPAHLKDGKVDVAVGVLGFGKGQYRIHRLATIDVSGDS